MSNHQGWISLHRKILDNPLFKEPKALTLWVYLLLRANHKDTKAIIGNSSIDIKRGQFLTGRKSLAEATGIQESKIERLLKLFENEHQIEQQKKSKYRLISIVKYESYQGDEQQLNNKRTTTEQQLNTDNNVNKGNNENKREAIPYQLIADAYNDFANRTDNPLVVKITNPRKAAIKKLWLSDIDSDNENQQTNNIEYWVRYFDHCTRITFLNNSTEKTGDHANWRPDFDFMMKEKTYIGIREGKYS
jgi:hypothetical protein